MSDSSYVSVTRHCRPFSTGRPAALELVDDAWAAASLEDDDLLTKPYETPMEDDELDGDVVVSTGTSSAAAHQAEERRRREEGWNDLGLDQLDDRETTNEQYGNAPATNNTNTTAS